MIQPKFEPTLTRMAIQIPLTKYTGQEQLAEARMLGYYPLVYYNGVSIMPEYIESLEITNDGFLPKLSVVFADRTEEMHRGLMAVDNTIITVYIDSRSKDDAFKAALRPIQIDFKITEYNYLREEKLFVVGGVMNIDGILLSEIKAYREQTSFEVVQQVARSCSIGFSTNINVTNDRMTWLNTDLKNYLFIQEIANKAYANERSFFTSFIDYYYSLNFIDVETQLKDDIGSQKGIMTAVLGASLGETSQKEMPLFLINKDAFNTTLNNTFDSYELNNHSLKTSVRNGYRTELYYYDKTGNWQQYAGTFVRFVLETLTDGQGIIMKSVPNDNKQDSFFNRNTRKVYDSPVDTDNMHEHYSYAPLLNESNLEEIQKVSMKLVMSEPNFNLYKYQKILILILDGKPNEADKKEQLNPRLSGGWLITSINYNYDKQSGLVQEVNVIKRELTDKNIGV